MTVEAGNITKYISAGRIYVGCTAPSTWAAPTLTDGIPADGTDLGATQGETVFTYNPNIELVEIEQVSSGVAPHVTLEELQMTCTLAESDADRVKEALGQTFVRSDGTNKVLHLGGNIEVTGQGIAVVGPLVGNPGKYSGGMIYNAYVAGEAPVSWQRGAERTISITFGGAGDPSREEGDQLGQYWSDEG